MHENVEYITKVIANYCYKGFIHNVLGPTGVNWFMSCSGVTVWTSIVRHGDVLTVVIVRRFEL